MEEAALSPGVGVMEAPETTMPGEPDGNLREPQPWWWPLGQGCEQREGWVCREGQTSAGGLDLFSAEPPLLPTGPGMGLNSGTHLCPSTAGVRVAATVIGARAGPTETAMTVMVSLAPRTPPEWLWLGSGNPCVLRAS